jgi:hypothetical protein
MQGFLFGEGLFLWAFSHWPLAISFLAQHNGIRSRWSLNGKE